MGEAVFFVVLKGVRGGEVPAIYYDRLPAWMTGKRAKERGLIYAVRLDKLGRGAELVELSLHQLHEQYVTLKAAGKLPPSNLVEPRKAEERKGRLEGDWWVPPSVPWDRKAPAYPPLPKGPPLVKVVDNG
jgi:hypothetical protein